MEWKEIALWALGAVLTLLTLGYRSHSTRLGQMESKLDSKASQAAHEALQARMREDVINLHAKIDGNAREQRKAMSEIQADIKTILREMRRN